MTKLIFEHTFRSEWVGGWDQSSGIKDRAGRAPLFGWTIVVAARINLENEGRGPELCDGCIVDKKPRAP